MDERLDYYRSEEMLRRVSSERMLGQGGSSESLERDSSRIFLQYKNYHLHLIEKKEKLSERTKIPATKLQRLAFYRQYVTTVSKIQVVCMQTSYFNYLFWNHFFNVIFKSLPHVYVTMFLASYTPEEHLFVPKMVPFFCGFKMLYMFTTFFELLNYLSNIILLLGYLIYGLKHTNAWHHCQKDVFEYAPELRCYDLHDFTKKIKNVSWTFVLSHYETSEGEKFQLLQLENFRMFALNLSITLKGIYFVIISVPAVMSHKLVTKKCFWKIITAAQWSVIFFEVVSYIYLINVTLEGNMKIIPPYVTELSNSLAVADVDMLAEGMTAPPVLHVLTARSTQEIDPSLDSVAIIVSNSLLYIFKGLLSNSLKNYCQSLVGVPILLSQFNEYAWFYIWPIFLSTFYFGELYTVLYMSLNLIVDVMTFTVAYHCFVETVVCEYKWLKRWIIAIVLAVSGLLVNSLLDILSRFLLNIYTKGILTFAEIIVLYYFYPVGRLADDITFHYGQPPTKLRVLQMRIMPFFYFIKMYLLIGGTMYVFETIDKKGKYVLWLRSWMIMPLPFLFGIIYIVYKYIIKDRLGWGRMFVPVCDWGPRDQVTRNLRKLYDSRNYIGSLAVRNLSRYIINKSESKAFQLDLNYEPHRRSTIATSMFRLETEKKED